MAGLELFENVAYLVGLVATEVVHQVGDIVEVVGDFVSYNCHGGSCAS